MLNAWEGQGSFSKETKFEVRTKRQKELSLSRLKRIWWNEVETTIGIGQCAGVPAEMRGNTANGKFSWKI